MVSLKHPDHYQQLQKVLDNFLNHLMLANMAKDAPHDQFINVS